MYCYTLGKEEIACNLSRDYKTKVIISEERFWRLEAIGIADKYFIKEKDYDEFRNQMRKVGMSDSEYNKNNVRIHIKQIKDRPHSISDLLKDKQIIHFMMTAMNH